MDVMSLYDVRTLGRMSNQLGLFRPRTFLLEKFFKWDGFVYGKDITVDIQTDTLAVSRYVNPRSEASTVERSGLVSKTYTLPYFKEKMITTIGDIFTRMPGQPVFANSAQSAAQIAGQLMAKDMMVLKSLIDRRSEQMAGEVLATGKLVVRGKGVDAELDFLRAAGNKVTLAGADKWDTTTADVVGDLKAMQDLCVDGSGLSPNMVIMGTDAFMSFLKHDSALKLLDNLRVVIGNIKSPENIELGANRYADMLGMEIWVYNQSYIDPLDGLKKAIFPTDGVLVSASVDVPLQDQRLYYGMIQDLDCDDAALPVFNKLDKTADPSSISLIQQCSRAPILIQPNATVFYDVQ